MIIFSIEQNSAFAPGLRIQSAFLFKNVLLVPAARAVGLVIFIIIII